MMSNSHGLENTLTSQVLKLGKTLKTIGLFMGVMVSSTTLASNTPEMREACYNTLLENIQETGIFPEAEKEFSGKSYGQVEAELSNYYKNLSSFGIDVDAPIFKQKIYSFGEQTGYVHPPFSPFPTYTESDKWEKPAKQNIYSEEYVADESGAKHFLSCGFFRTESADLMGVTSERYLYDGDLISVLKNVSNGKYKAWYNENISYDHNNSPFVTWKRLFVYPESSVNSYFNRYDIAEAFPSNAAESLDIFVPKVPKFSELSSEEQATLKELSGKKNPTEEELQSLMGDGAPRVYMTDQNGKIKKSIAPKELQPIQMEENSVFALKSYYDAIENYFPEFANHLALRGSIKYTTLKKLITHKEATELSHVWATALDTKEITKYALAKEDGTIKEDSKVDFYETYLPQIPTMDTDALELLSKVESKKSTPGRKRPTKEVSQKEPLIQIQTDADTESVDTTKNALMYLGGGVLALMLIIILFYAGRKK